MKNTAFLLLPILFTVFIFPAASQNTEERPRIEATYKIEVKPWYLGIIAYFYLRSKGMNEIEFLTYPLRSEDALVMRDTRKKDVGGPVEAAPGKPSDFEEKIQKSALSSPLTLWRLRQLFGRMVTEKKKARFAEYFDTFPAKLSTGKDVHITALLWLSGEALSPLEKIVDMRILGNSAPGRIETFSVCVVATDTPLRRDAFSCSARNGNRLFWGVGYLAREGPLGGAILGLDAHIRIWSDEYHCLFTLKKLRVIP